MTSIVKLLALSGAMDESPPCYILQVDDFRFLLDCGWDESFDQEFMRELKKHVGQIDAVLLSYPDNLHLGALPYLVGKCGLSCPIYATTPVYKMGQMFMYDLYQSRYNMEDFTIFNLDDVDAAFDKVTQLKYNQTVPMRGKCYGLSIVPLPAGHMIGGTIWKIMKEGEEDIIYAIDFNHKKERHLNGCDLEKMQIPSLLITDAFNATYQQARRKVRDEKLMTAILSTTRDGGNILIAADTSGRLLELAHMLDMLWRDKKSGLIAYPLCLLNNVCYNVIEFAKSQIEWMSDKLVRSFEAMRNNPFQLKHMHLCHSLSELNKIKSPKVVLASMPDLECGFSRDIFIEWSGDPKNSIVLTSRTCKGTLARNLLDEGIQRTIEVNVKQRVKLEGQELEEYKRLHFQQQEDLSDEKDSSESEDDLQVLSVTRGTHDLVVKSERKRKNSRAKRKTYPMFPLHDVKLRMDEYGELIVPEDYKLSEVLADQDVKEIKPKEEEVVDITEAPTKCISYTAHIDLKAQIQYIDFEGRSDGESMQKIVAQLRPRKVILVRGSRENTQLFAKYISQWTEARVFTPSKGDTIDVTSDNHIYQVRLTDSLTSNLLLQKGKDSELAWIDAIATRKGKAPDTIENMDVDSQNDGDLLSLDPAPLNEIEPHRPVFINEIKLSDLKLVLLKHGIQSEFSGGSLWCYNGTIAIRRLQTGKFCLEGWISENYYKIREILYSQYAIL